MTDQMQDNVSELDDLLNHATDLTENKVAYISNIRFTVSATEVTMDLYAVGRNPTDIRLAQASRIHRIIIPLSLAKDIASLLTAAVANWETTFGITLPLMPKSLDGVFDADQFRGVENDDNTTP